MSCGGINRVSVTVILFFLFMNETHSQTSTVGRWVFGAAMIIGFCVVLSAHLIAQGYVTSKEQSNLNVAALNGIAERIIEADQAKWSLYMTRSSATSSNEVTRLLQEDEQAIREYLKEGGILEAEISVHPMDIEPSSYTSYGHQTIVVESKQVEKLGALATEAETVFIKAGRSISTNNIEFYYSDLTTLQKELTKLAIQDARAQGKDLFGEQFDRIQSIGTSVLQVTPENASGGSYDYGYRSSDTSSIKKKALVTVGVTFLLK